MERDPGTLGSMRSALEAMAATPSPSVGLLPGTVLDDRFRIEERLGIGGMGVVYRARDARMGREVALKLTAYAANEERLRKEALALARLSHPHVVTAYEVVDLEVGIVIVMELVTGATVRKWLAARPRSWREILAVYRQAGEGLAAIHGAGLVHRDFKPDNVMVGVDGRVRVTDLGLADAEHQPERAGTSSYMAPEALAARASDARSDQYSFAVSLAEALQGIAAPARLRRIVARGAAAEPATRYPAMDALLEELGRDPRRAQRRALAAAGIAAALALVAWVSARVSSRSGICGGSEELLAGAWDAPTRGAIRDAFQATNLPFAADTLARAERALDDYAAGWARMHREACEAGSIRREHSEEILDRRMACLGARLGGLRALTAAMAGPPSSEAVENAVAAVTRLEPLAGCADLDALAAAYPPPPPAQRRAVEALRGEVQGALALRELGRRREAVTRGHEALARARVLAYPPLVAAALFTLGRSQLDVQAERPLAKLTLREALLAAAAARDDVLAARVWINLIVTLPGEEALAQYTAARAAVARAGDPDDLLAAVQGNLALVLLRLGRFGEARPLLEQVLASPETARDPVVRLATLNALGRVHSHLGRVEEALASHARARAIAEEALGPEHPLVAETTTGLASRLRDAGRLQEALVEIRRARSIQARVQGPESGEVARLLANEATILLEARRFAGAYALLLRADAIQAPRLAPDHPDLLITRHNLGGALVGLGRVAEGRRILEEILPLLERRSPRSVPGHLVALSEALRLEGRPADAERAARRALSTIEAAPSFRPDAQRELGKALLARGRAAAALAALHEALALVETALGPQAPRTAIVRADVGQALLARGRAGDAVPVLDAAHAALAASGDDFALHRARAHLDLARALWRAGDRERARREAAAAREELLRLGEDGAIDAARADRELGHLLGGPASIRRGLR